MGYLDRLNDVLPKSYIYEYKYFEKESDTRLQVKTLNIVQCFFRKLLGWYAETRLLPTARKAYAITLNQDVADPKESGKLITLLEKGQKKYKEKSNLPLPEFTHSNGSRVKINVSYDLGSKTEYTNKTFKTLLSIRSINFKVNINGKDHKMSIHRSPADCLESFELDLPDDLFIGRRNQTAPGLKTQLTTGGALIINELLRKVFKDSIGSSLQGGIDYAGTNYNNAPVRDSEAFNEAQADAMKEMGWSGPRLLYKGNNGRSYQLFTLTGEAAGKLRSLNEEGLTQPFNLAFKAHHLVSYS